MGIHSNTYKNYTTGDKDPSEDEVTATQKAQDKTISTGKICVLLENYCTWTSNQNLVYLEIFFSIDVFSEPNFLPYLELFCIWDLWALII